MARMRAIDAAVRVLEREGVSTAFGVPGAAINPFYAAISASVGSIRHILARHVEARVAHGRRLQRAPCRATSACASAPLARPAPT